MAGEVGFVVAPDALHTVIKSLRFLAVAPGKILVVQVTEPDVVISRVLETDAVFSPAELESLSERMTREYGGLTLHEVRRRMIAELAREREEADRFRQRAAEFLSEPERRGISQDSPDNAGSDDGCGFEDARSNQPSRSHEDSRSRKEQAHQ